MKNPYDQYKQIQINTAGRGQLVVMMYEGAIKNLNRAIENLKPQSYDIANNAIIKTQDIITELMMSLDKSAGEIASKLESIYMYINNRLLEANMEKNQDILVEIKNHLESLLEAWKEAARQTESTAKRMSASSISIKG